VSLKGRIQVEPLSEDRLIQIERHVVAGAPDRLGARLRTPRRLLAWVSATAALTAAVIVGWRLHGVDPAPVQSIAVETPHVFVIQTSSEHAPGSIVEAGGAKIASEPGSDVRVSQTSDRIVLQMQRGKIALDVAHRAGRTVVVLAGDTQIEDVGTKFTVEFDGTNRVDVRVTEGEVNVTRQHRTVRVAAGFAWTTDGGLIATAELAHIELRPAMVTTNGPTPTPVGGATTHATTLPSPPRRIEPRIVAEVPPRPVAASDPYVELRVAIRNQPIALDPRLDGQRDAAAEIARLKPVAYSPQTYGAEASRALYKMAVLLYKPLRQNSEALRTLEMYLRRFPTGQELASVLWLRLRIACAHGGMDDECRHAAYSYQHQVPTGPAADVAIRILNAP
jgi:hypothetical protein